MSAILLQIQFRPEFYEDDGLVTAFCHELGLAAGGTDEASASAALSATVRTYCDILERKGVLQQTLRDADVRSREITVDKPTADDVVLVVGSGRSLEA